MGMKPPMHEPFGTVSNVCSLPKKTGHYDGIANTNTTMKPTEDPTPANAGSGTTTKGPVPKA